MEKDCEDAFALNCLGNPRKVSFKDIVTCAFFIEFSCQVTGSNFFNTVIIQLAHIPVLPLRTRGMF